MDKVFSGEAQGWVLFVIIACFAIIGLAWKFLVWYARQLIERTQSRLDSHEGLLKIVSKRLDDRDRADATLENRLKAGAEAMAKVNEQVMDLATRYVDRQSHEQRWRAHEAIHLELEARLSAVEVTQAKIVKDLDRIVDRFEQGFDKLKDAVTRHIEVPRGST